MSDLKTSYRAVDVIIPVYAGFDETCAAIVTAAKSIDHRWARLVVINDCSPEPEITQWLRDQHQALGFELHENSSNLGFVGTVNKGMQLHPEADVLLLNSDVEVANDWLERLQQAAYSHAQVASVTATANNATVCSFPVFCEDNELPTGLSLEEIDQAFKDSVPATTSVALPTGVGCCMYMRRDAIELLGLFDEEAYGRGYGEENDWCQRAIAAGWTNLHALNVFVYHKGAVSFAEESNPRKDANLLTLLKRYPAYNADVQRFIAEDPAREWRLLAYVKVLAAIRKPKVLLIAHGMGGGVYTHLRELIAEQQELVYLLLEPITGGTVRLHLKPFSKGLYLDFEIEADYPQLLKLLSAAGVGHVHFHHTLGLPTRVWGVARDLSVSMDYTLHDYTIVNGNPALLGKDGIFVGDHAERDRLCAERIPLPTGVTAKQWRENQLFLLDRARYLICPSADMHRRLSSLDEFSHLKSWVIAPHMDNHRLDNNLQPPERGTEPLKVLVLGALSPEKGADVLETVATEIQDQHVQFHLLGYAYRVLNERVITHGAYAESDAIQLIKEISPHVVWFPALCAETYSYTLSLALEAGLPVVASDIGAFPERLAGRAGSYLFKQYTDSNAWVEFWNSVASDYSRLLSETVDRSRAVSVDTAFYHQAYTDGLASGTVTASVTVDLIRAQMERALLVDRSCGRRRWIFDKLLSLLSTRWGARVGRLIPVRLQRRIKRLLVRGAIHE